MNEFIGKGIASIAVCAAGAYAMYISNGETGIGWFYTWIINNLGII